MINMGLKTADICDLDNRPKEAKNIEKLNKLALDSSFDNISMAADSEADVDKKSMVSKNAERTSSTYAIRKAKTNNPLLNAKNYPFYQKVKRNLYMME